MLAVKTVRSCDLRGNEKMMLVFPSVICYNKQ